MKKSNAIRITKEGEQRLNALLGSFLVNDYHKTLLRSIKANIPKKNVQKADVEVFETISQQYPSEV